MRRASGLVGKTALVTGAGGGLGRATALKFAEAGANVCLVDADVGGLEGTLAEVQAFDVGIYVHVSDLTKAENGAKTIAAATEYFGRLDALCNVATVFYPAKADQMPVADWQEMVAINLSAPFLLIQAAIPHLIENGGAIVNVTSCAAFMAKPFTGAYAATKAALTHLTKALAAEYVDQPIRINAVAPGSMAVSIATSVKIPLDIDLSQVQKLSPGRGLIAMEEVAEVIVFLASDAASGFHGASISIDNGIRFS